MNLIKLVAKNSAGYSYWVLGTTALVVMGVMENYGDHREEFWNRDDPSGRFRENYKKV